MHAISLIRLVEDSSNCKLLMVEAPLFVLICSSSHRIHQMRIELQRQSSAEDQDRTVTVTNNKKY